MKEPKSLKNTNCCFWVFKTNNHRKRPLMEVMNQVRVERQFKVHLQLFVMMNLV